MAKAFQVAIVGASGSGKTWLARRLCASLAPDAILVNQDSFYRDLSPLAPERREAINFDDPDAIDWPCFRQAVEALGSDCAALVPAYDFSTHTRMKQWQHVGPADIVLWDGLWLLHDSRLRERFDLKLFVDCPAAERLARRIERDVLERGRTSESVRRQFQQQVEPMRQRFIEPQRPWVERVLTSPLGEETLAGLVAEIRKRAARCASAPQQESDGLQTGPGK